MDGFHEINPEDMPPEFREMVEKLIQKTIMSSGMAHDMVADEIMPSKEQLALEPGDTVALVRSSEGDADNDLVVAEILNPEDHAEEFPDWEERLLNSYLLTRWYTDDQPLGRVGWLVRAKLVKFPREHWEALRRWVLHPEEAPKTPPNWLIIRYNESLVGQQEANPMRLPKPVRCPECDSPGVLIRVVNHREDRFAMGVPPSEQDADEPGELHVISPYGGNGYAKSYLECHNCGHEEEQPEELQLYK